MCVCVCVHVSLSHCVEVRCIDVSLYAKSPQQAGTVTERQRDNEPARPNRTEAERQSDRDPKRGHSDKENEQTYIATSTQTKNRSID